MVAPEFHNLTIKSIKPETANAISLTFDVPENLAEAFQFDPGQYLTLRAEVDGQDIRRSYSICSAASDRDLSVGIKRVEDGVFSNYAFNLKEGDHLQVMSPQGRFSVALGGTHHYLLLAAGSGVTPILSIARSVLEAEEGSSVTFCYSNRGTDSVMFKDDIETLKDKYMTRFLLTHLMTQEEQDIALLNGRLNAEKIEMLAARGMIAPESYDAVFICGPQEMIDGTRQALETLGVPKSRIKYELFTPSSPMKARKAKEKSSDCDGTKIGIVLNGSQRNFILPAGEVLIEAAQKAGIDVPYSCANGMCATCRCKLTKGRGDMAQNFSLEDWEVEAGFVLSCQLQPESDELVLDFDAS